MNTPFVDLRSDAVTLPSTAMREAMAAALVGDDDYGEDPTINLLEERAASLLGKEAALFVNSGTMGNLLGILSQTQTGEAVVAGLHSHIFDHEYPGVQSFCGVVLRPIAETVEQGRLTWDRTALSKVLVEPPHSRPVLLCLEQTINRLGGVVMPLGHMAEICSMAHEHGLCVHLDGARLLNAALALGVTAATLTQNADTVMTVFTKCLGAPGGAVLAGPEAVIATARRRRHYLGGGLKQGGIVAAACLVALEQFGDLVADHRRAKDLANGLAALPKLGIEVENVVSNIVLADVRPLGIDHQTALATLKRHGVLAQRAMPGILRLVLHRDIDDDGVRHTIAAFQALVAESVPV
jgi:threonine aldolase